MKIVIKEGNCFRCLGGQHLSADCKKNVNCSVNGCNRKHHPLLHGGLMPSTTSDQSQSSRRPPPKLTGANAEHGDKNKGTQKTTSTPPHRRSNGSLRQQKSPSPRSLRQWQPGLTHPQGCGRQAKNAREESASYYLLRF